MRWPETISNRELWKRTKQKLAEDKILQRRWIRIWQTLWKPMTCITHQALKITHRERESEAAQETPGASIWRLKQKGLVIPGDSLKGWPRLGMPGELLWVAYAPIDDDNDNVEKMHKDINPQDHKPSLTLPLCRSLAVIYHSLSLLETLVLLRWNAVHGCTY